MVISSTSAMERALSIPELLDVIFGMLDRWQNVQNTRVCKTWAAAASDILWREVANIRWLFSFLAPLQRNPQTRDLEFRKIPDADCWKKFERYSFRVRRLELLHYMKLPPSAINIVARTRLRPDILPNLQTLVCEHPVARDVAVVFMHPGVKKFEIWIHGELDSLSPFLHQVALRMPDISNLNIRSQWPVDEYEADLIHIITQLSKLHTITLPPYHLTTKVVEALAQLPDLVVIQCHPSYRDSVPVPLTVRLNEGAFPTLRNLSLQATFDEVSPFLEHKCFPKRLTYLYVESGIETGESVYEFLCGVAEKCPLLRALYLRTCLGEDGISRSPSQVAQFKIMVDQLKPLFKLSDLKSLEISQYYFCPYDFRGFEWENVTAANYFGHAIAEPIRTGFIRQRFWFQDPSSQNSSPRTVADKDIVYRDTERLVLSQVYIK